MLIAYTDVDPQPHPHSHTADIIIVRKEAYPYPPDIPEGRWAVYEVTLPNKPTHPLTIIYHTLTPTITLSPFQMTFEPEVWNIPQELTVVAIEDEINMASPYRSGFNLTLVSEDKNYGGQLLPDFNITVEDNDQGTCIIYLHSKYYTILFVLMNFVYINLILVCLHSMSQGMFVMKCYHNRHCLRSSMS